MTPAEGPCRTPFCATCGDEHAPGDCAVRGRSQAPPFYDPSDGGITDLATSASSEDLRLAVDCIGPNARYGGLLNCVLAGIYAERSRSATSSTSSSQGSGEIVTRADETTEPNVGRALEFLNAVYHHPDVQGTDAQRWARMACEALRPGWQSPTVADGDRSVHKPFPDDGVMYCGWDGHDGCGETWPCSTVRATTEPSSSGEQGS